MIIKLFLYISREEQKKRFKKLEESGETAWRVTKEDWKRNEDYDRYLKINEEMLERTDTEYAPWTIIEATDKSYGAMKILKTVTETLEDALAKTAELIGKITIAGMILPVIGEIIKLCVSLCGK